GGVGRGGNRRRRGGEAGGARGHPRLDRPAQRQAAGGALPPADAAAAAQGLLPVRAALAGRDRHIRPQAPVRGGGPGPQLCDAMPGAHAARPHLQSYVGLTFARGFLQSSVTSFPLSASQRRKVRSRLPVSTGRPSGQKTTLVTPAVCPAKRHNCPPVATSHRRTPETWSYEPLLVDTARVPSGETATLQLAA